MKGTMLLDMNKILMWRLTRDQTKYELAFQKLGANNGFGDKANDGRQSLLAEIPCKTFDNDVMVCVGASRHS